MELIILIILIGNAFTYMDYQVKEKDKSIEGYFRWIKEKFIKKD